MLLALALVLLAAGIVVTVRAWRGRAVDDHPVCCACSYDLVGSLDGDRCPECGADITAAGAMRQGNRKRHRSEIAAGLGLVLLSVCMFGGWLYFNFADYDWIQIKPFGWTLDAAVTAAGVPNEPNVAELKRRFVAGSLSDARVLRLVEESLTVQGDRSIAWPGAWSQLLDDLLAAGRLSEAQIKRYFEQALVVELKVKPVVRRGRGLSLDLDNVIDRMTPATQFFAERHAEAVTLGGVAFIDAGSFEASTSGYPTNSFSYGYRMGISLDRDHFATVPDGPTTIESAFVYELTLVQPAKYGPVTLRVPVSIPIELAGYDAIVDEFIVDEAKRDAVDASWTQTRVETDGKGVSVWLRIEQPPVALAMGVWLHQDEKAWNIGTLHVEGGSVARWYMIESRRARHPANGAITVELRPDQAVTDHLLVLGSYWGAPLSRTGIIVNAPYTPSFNMDASLAPAMEQAVYLDRVVASGDKISASLQARTCPARVAYCVRVRTGSGWVDAADHITLNARVGDICGYSTGGLPLPDPDATHIDIMFVPDREWEAHSSDLTPPWGYPILFEHIPLVRDQPSGPIYGKAQLGATEHAAHTHD